MKRRVSTLALLLSGWLAGCAVVPPAPVSAVEEFAPESVEVPTPLVEYPPIEPVEPPFEPVAPAAAATPAPGVVIASPVAPEAVAAPAPDRLASAAPSPIATPPAATVVPAPVVEDSELVVLVADLQRYGAFSPEDVRRELANMTQTLARQRTDANRVRLAVLYSLSHANPQDDQRALQLLENVSRSNPGSPAVKQLASILLVQISGRQRAVREEQQKADAALQKLEALRQMERSLLRDRVRSGGGGGGSGGGGSGGGGSGGGGQ